MIDYVWIVVPSPEYPHWQAFSEIAASFSAALQDLGHPAKLFKGPAAPNGKALVFGGHLLKNGTHDDAIIYNSEQIFPDQPWMTPQYTALLQSHEVWDYSENNTEALKAYGVAAKLCPVGYMPVLEDIDPAPVQDMDVVLVGSECPRRNKIMADLNAAGIRAYFITGYGKWRNSYIARAKIVLNIHYYDTAIFEIFRCAHLFANRKAVISESGKDTRLETKFYPGAKFGHYDDLVTLCKKLLVYDNMPSDLGHDGYETILDMPQTEYLKAVL